MANTNIDGTISTLFHGMDGFVSSKSVVGDPIKVGDTIIIPLLDVNFGMAAGAVNKQELEQERLQGIRRIMPVVE